MVKSVHATDLHNTPHTSQDGDPVHQAMNGPVHDEWREPRNLDAPSPLSGYVQRWVRIEDRSGKDHLNLQNKMREGWRPRALESIPEEFRNFPILKHAQLGDVLYVGGCVLMQMPVQLAESRGKQVKARIARQNRAVEEDSSATSRQGVQRGMSPIVREEQIKTSRREPVIQG